jgi:hypothetical protein
VLDILVFGPLVVVALLIVAGLVFDTTGCEDEGAEEGKEDAKTGKAEEEEEEEEFCACGVGRLGF